MALEVLSVVVSVATLLVVSVTAVLLLRQTRIAQLQATHNMQLELVRMGLEHPHLGAALGDRKPEPQAAHRQSYRNLWLRYHQMNFMIGEMGEDEVRRVVRYEIFGTPEGVEQWTHARSGWLDGARADQTVERFVEMVDQEHRAALANDGSAREQNENVEGRADGQ